MPRNCGCSGRCDCIITNGAGITVTGRGSPDQPYVIEATGEGGGGGGGADPGDLKWTARPSAPAGWLICDGAAVPRSSYAGLFAAIGTLFGAGDGTSTFNVPDFTGRFALGADSSHPHGTSGGAETRTLSANQLPSHSHSMNHDHPQITTSSAGSHSHATRSSGTEGGSTLAFMRSNNAGVINGGGMVSPDGAHTHTADIPNYVGSTGNTGGGDPVNVMPPWTAALPLIKT